MVISWTTKNSISCSDLMVSFCSVWFETMLVHEQYRLFSGNGLPRSSWSWTMPYSAVQLMLRPGPAGPGRNINWTALYGIVHDQELLGKPFPLKSLYCSCTNIVSNQTEQNETIKSLQEIEFLVVQEMTMSDTCLLYTSRCV